MSKLNITAYPKFGHYKRRLSSDSLKLSEIIPNRQISIINDLFEEEFNCFGYEMIA